MKSKTVQSSAHVQQPTDCPVYETVELKERSDSVSMSLNVAYGNVN